MDASSDGMKYCFWNLLNRRRAAILDSYEYTFVSAKSLILHDFRVYELQRQVKLEKRSYTHIHSNL
ncbi:MAG: hypothetical protein C5S48_04430 [Candidatus Methanogaster sp.]|nr:MAG: hypothetical protein C5S48_04430 [ANME-2 cluster archaeon]